MNSDEKLLRKMARLRVDRSRGIAPHKPILLLVILELAKSGLLSGARLALTPELAFRFAAYWSVVAHRRSQRPDVRLPFHHLKTSNFWLPLTVDGSVSKHREFTTSIEFADEFFRAIASPVFCERSAQVLIETYFEPAEKVALYELTGVSKTKDLANLRELSSQANKEALVRGRTARFRVDVTAAYCHTCALTGYRITTISGHSIVDAAHIHQFAHSRNDDPQNGIALSKNAHWLFDLGLWSVDSEYCVIVAGDKFEESNPQQASLISQHGKRIQLPIDERLWPDLRHLEWHRRNRFLGSI